MERYIALAGNPNSGKTTLFNALTGARQYVGNWPGVTVERKTGRMSSGGEIVNIVDLPGIYSLSTSSIEEIVTREYLESDEPDVILNIVDATNLEKNLFLTLQLIESGKPVIVALNMFDEVEKQGIEIDRELLSESIGAPVVAISASREQGIDRLLQGVLGDDLKNAADPGIYTPDVSRAIAKIELEVGDIHAPRLHAISFIETGGISMIGHKVSSEKLDMLNELVAGLEKAADMDRDMIISDEKYRFITSVVSRCVKKPPVGEKLTATEKIDRVVTNRFLAIPIFFGIMFVIFGVAFGPAGAFLKSNFEYLINDVLISGAASLLESGGAPDWAYDLVVSGIFGGVGSVLSFLPEIAVLFLMLSVLEDSGYMSRAAFITDKMLYKFGLSGKAFIPMILGFGCTVPALMATRTLESERDRRITMVVTPFMSCSARLPVYAVFAGAFFAENQVLVIFSIYLLGIAVALLSAMFLKKILGEKKGSSYLMELPEYRFTTFKNIGLHTWQRVKGFVVRAGTLLLAASVIIWFVQSFDFSLELVQDSSRSMLGSFGKLISPVFAPLGFGDWRASVALLTGFVAKEAVVGTLGILYGVGEVAAESPELLGETLKSVFTPLSAYGFMVFTLLYMPCVAAFSTLKREMRSWKWTLSALAYQTGAAWAAAFAIYQAGSLLIR